MVWLEWTLNNKTIQKWDKIIDLLNVPIDTKYLTVQLAIWNLQKKCINVDWPHLTDTRLLSQAYLIAIVLSSHDNTSVSKSILSSSVTLKGLWFRVTEQEPYPQTNRQWVLPHDPNKGQYGFEGREKQLYHTSWHIFQYYKKCSNCTNLLFTWGWFLSEPVGILSMCMYMHMYIHTYKDTYTCTMIAIHVQW